MGKVWDLQELAHSLAVTLKPKGNQHPKDCRIQGVATLDKATTNQLSFLSNRQYRSQLLTTQAAAVIVTPQDEEACPVHALVSKNPRLILAKAMSLLQPESVKPAGIHPTAIVGQGCHIASTAVIGPKVVIGNNVTIGEQVILGAGVVVGDNSRIGENTELKPNVTLYSNVTIGHTCFIQSGTVVGGDGFGYAEDKGTWVKMPHWGGVVIGNKVEIGANTCIDRGMLEDTVVEDGVIIDNLVQIAHNVTIGAHTAIAGCTAIAGSVKIGKNCLIGGCCIISGHLEIADRVILTGSTGVNHSIKKPGIYSSGFPAKENAVWRKNVARFAYLDKMYKRLRHVEKTLQITPIDNLQEEEI